MDHKTITKLTSSFDTLVHEIPEESIEFWYAREIMTALGYDRWENFSKVIHKVAIACETAGGVAANHFRGVTKMVPIGSGAERPVEDIMLQPKVSRTILLSSTKWSIEAGENKFEDSLQGDNHGKE